MNAEHYDLTLLAEARRKRFTQQQLAEKLDVTEMTISRAEKGQGVSYELLLAICTEIGVDITTILRPPASKIFCSVT